MDDPMVLCVDDDEAVIRSLEREFRGAPFSFVGLHSAQEGLDYLADKRVSVVVSDHRMPGMQGVEFLEAVRQRDPDTFRVMLTAYGDVETVSSAVNRAGIHRIVTKPWDRDALMQILQQGLDHARRTRARTDLPGRWLAAAYQSLCRKETTAVQSRLLRGVVLEALGPLSAAVSKVAEVERGDGMDETDRWRLEMARGKVELGVRILKALLWFSAPEASRKELTDIRAIVTHTLALYAHEIKRRGVHLHLDVNGVPALQLDRRGMAQLVANLIGNAMDAMSGAGGRIWIGASPVRCADGSSWVEVRVGDSGRGMTEAERRKAAVPFYTTKPEAAGVGLSVCKRIAQDHGGSLEIRSRGDKGTEVAVRLPAPRGDVS
jgi:signal transduction histidine kinase